MVVGLVKELPIPSKIPANGKMAMGRNRDLPICYAYANAREPLLFGFLSFFFFSFLTFVVSLTAASAITQNTSCSSFGDLRKTVSNVLSRLTTPF